MDFLEEECYISIEKFLDHPNMISLLNSNNFSTLYDAQIASSLNMFETGAFTDLLYKSNIDPLSYMSIIPEGYLYNSKISGIYIPDNITIIRNLAFGLCTNLRDIRMSNNIELLEKFVFPDEFKSRLSKDRYGVGYIGNESNQHIIATASDNGSSISLDTLRFNNDCKIIDTLAFSAALINRVIIPKSVINIGQRAFNQHDLYIEYEGTLNDFNKIELTGAEPFGYQKNPIVHCTDGDFKL